MPWPPEIGKVIPTARAAHGVHEKLCAYSLNRNHREGADKARIFRAVLGLTVADVDYLAEALLEGLAHVPVRRVRENQPYGVLCDVWITVDGLRNHANQPATVRTAWELRYEDDAPRLVTAYIKN